MQQPPDDWQNQPPLVPQPPDDWPHQQPPLPQPPPSDRLPAANQAWYPRDHENPARWPQTPGDATQTDPLHSAQGLGSDGGGDMAAKREEVELDSEDVVSRSILISGQGGSESSIPITACSDDYIQQGEASGTFGESSESFGTSPHYQFCYAPSTDYITPAGTSLKRGMACKFCRRRKLRCSGERPSCSSCVKYKQECEYQPPVRVTKVHAVESSRMAELSDYVNQSSIPGVHSAFSSVPLGYGQVPGAEQQQVPGTIPDSFGFQAPQGFYSLGLPHGSGAPPTINNFEISNSHINFSHPHLPAHTLPGQPGQPNPFANYASQPAMQYGALPSFVPEPSLYVAPQTVPAETSPPGSTLPPQVAQFDPIFSANIPISSAASLPPSSYDALGLKRPSNSSATAPGPSRPSSNSSITVPGPSRPSSTPGGFAFPPDQNSPTPIIPSRGYRSSTSSAIHTPPANQPSSSPRHTTLPSSTPSISTLNLEFVEGAQGRFTAEPEPADPAVEGLSERLGEFLFSPDGAGTSSGTPTTTGTPEDPEWTKKRRTGRSQDGQGQWMSGGKAGSDTAKRSALITNRVERDGLKDTHRELLLDYFLAHCRLFFEMSVPRFRYRMTFMDRRRPSLALLNAMYLWGTRLSQAPNAAVMEIHFFQEACKYLDSSGPNNDRLIDAVRAAMLLSAYSYTNGRHHEGWLVAGVAVRLVLSTGIHQIQSLSFRPAAPDNPFLRNRVFLLSPPEDPVELAERVHAFWCVYAIERCGALATGFPSALADSDISTPFGRPHDIIASQSVTMQDDVTVRDLYRGTARAHPEGDTPYIQWIKAVTILERASKLAFLEPADDSQYLRSWTEHAAALSSGTTPNPTPPPGWLNQPKYRNPREYAECKFALYNFVESLKVDGISPIERRRTAGAEGNVDLVIGSKIVLLHHHIAATEMLLHDINSPDVANQIALHGARKSVDLFRHLPPLGFQEIDAEIVLVWSMIAKVIIKEIDRCARIADMASLKFLVEDVDVIINELHRVGAIMTLSRSQGKAMEELKKVALSGGHS